MNIVETRNLGKTYGKTVAVDHFDMHVQRGDIYGFVGRNGAGKSTVMKMISGLAHPSSGEIFLFGKTLDEQKIPGRIGALIESPGIYPRMNAYDNMMLKALSFGVVKPKPKVEQLLAYVGLASAGNKKTKQYSMGMKQRLGLALALIGDPDILLLDEPLNGLDPEGVREMRQLLLQLNEERGMTILISSHVLEQLGKIVTRYGVIRQGSMVRELSIAEVDEECRDFVKIVVADTALALAVLQNRFGDNGFQVLPDSSIKAMGTLQADAIGEVLGSEGIAVHGLYTHKRDLEEFFVELMGGENHD